jgi:hypothetical protein
MQYFYPLKRYFNILISCTIIALILILISPQNKTTLIASTYIIGLAYLLPTIVLNPKVILNHNNTLTYKTLFTSKKVNLDKLTNCSYYLQLYGRGWPIMQFHLYDADGGFADFPANCWTNQKILFDAIKQAISNQHISINKKTATKLRLNSV